MKHIDLLLINPPFHMRNGSGNFFPLGLGYIISSVEAHNYTWAIVDCTKIITTFFTNNLKIFAEKIQIALNSFSPKIIGIGPCITSQLKALNIIVQCCRKLFPNVPVIAGGPFASIDGQEWVFFEKLGIQYIIKGDAEEAIPDAINAIKRFNDISYSKFVSTPRHFYYNIVSDLNTLPFPYRRFDKNHIFSIRRSTNNKYTKTAAIVASRGCNYNCRYCVSGNIKLNSVRNRTNENIINEMNFLNSHYKINDFVFYDDCFFNTPQTVCSEINAFCNLLLCKNLKFSWQIELRPDVLTALDDASIYILGESGCRQINIGIEKVTESGLKFLGKTSTFFGLSEYNYHIKNISSIKLSATFILGGENECRDDVIHLINESKNINLDYAHFNPLFVYPGTPLYYDIFSDEKSWVDFILKDNLPWGEIVYENKYLKRSDLLELIDVAYASFYRGSKHASQNMIIDRFNIKKGEDILDNL